MVIDVSQSVDLDHPQALQFLREDALHINNFFGRCWQLTWVVQCAMWQHRPQPDIGTSCTVREVTSAQTPGIRGYAAIDKPVAGRPGVSAFHKPRLLADPAACCW